MKIYSQPFWKMKSFSSVWKIQAIWCDDILDIMWGARKQFPKPHTVLINRNSRSKSGFYSKRNTWMTADVALHTHRAIWGILIDDGTKLNWKFCGQTGTSSSSQIAWDQLRFSEHIIWILNKTFVQNVQIKMRCCFYRFLCISRICRI